MIAGFGHDLCDIEAVGDALANQGQRFRNRLCSLEEQTQIRVADEPFEYAIRFAIKEACAKALGTGLTDRVRWQHMRVAERAPGRYDVTLSEGAYRRARWLARSPCWRLHVTASRCGLKVIAFVLIETAAGGGFLPASPMYSIEPVD